MKKVLALVLTLAPIAAFAQSPKAATYITDEEIKRVNSLPGVDRQIVSVDIGKLNEAVGIVHRGPTGAPAARGLRGGVEAGAAARGGAAAAGRGGEAAGGGGRGAAQTGAPAARSVRGGVETEACGAQVAPAPAGGTNGILHDHQTETYIIVSGGGTLVTGGRIVNGRKSAPDSDVTRILNGPSCSGIITGTDVVRKQVKTGDVIIIPAGVPHGWSDIPDHVDYLSVRPDPDRVLPRDYVNPAIRK